MFCGPRMVRRRSRPETSGMAKLSTSCASGGKTMFGRRFALQAGERNDRGQAMVEVFAPLRAGSRRFQRLHQSGAAGEALLRIIVQRL